VWKGASCQLKQVKKTEHGVLPHSANLWRHNSTPPTEHNKIMALFQQMPGGNQNYKWLHRSWESAGQIYKMEFSKYSTMQEYQGLHHGILYNSQTKCNFDMWLTVHRSSMWNKIPTRCHLVLYLFLLYKLPNMFQATLCPSSGADDLVVFFHVWCSAVAV